MGSIKLLKLSFLAVVLVAAVLVMSLAGCVRPYTYHGLLLESPKPVADFTLTAAGGKPVSLSDFRGKLTVLYFGYTFCPDICPTTLSDMAKVMKELGPKAKDVQFVMVSVDPDRDTPEKLAEYVSYFDPSFVGVTGTPDQIAAAATPFGIFYQKHEGTAASGYLVDHTASLNVVDQEGRMRLVLPYGTAPKDVANDLSHLLRQR